MRAGGAFSARIFGELSGDEGVLCVGERTAVELLDTKMASRSSNPVFKLAVGKYWYASEYAELQAKRQEAFPNVEISVT